MDPSARPTRPSRADRRRAIRDNAFRYLRSGVMQKMAEYVKADPDRERSALAAGLNRDWLDDPDNEQLLRAPPRELVHRFLEREIERKPSVLAELGLSALQVLDSYSEDASPGDRVEVAIAFCDLDDFTAYCAREGDEAAGRLIAANESVVRPAVRSRGGRIVKKLGDGYLLSFPAAEAGVLACLEIVESVTSPLPMRAGVHWGQPLLVRGDLIGHDVNIAARVTDLAEGGEVLVTAALTGEVGTMRDVAFDEPELERIDGLDDPVAVCIASRTGPPASGVTKGAG